MDDKFKPIADYIREENIRFKSSLELLESGKILYVRDVDNNNTNDLPDMIEEYKRRIAINERFLADLEKRK